MIATHCVTYTHHLLLFFSVRSHLLIYLFLHSFISQPFNYLWIGSSFRFNPSILEKQTQLMFIYISGDVVLKAENIHSILLKHQNWITKLQSLRVKFCPAFHLISFLEQCNSVWDSHVTKKIIPKFPGNRTFFTLFFLAQWTKKKIQTRFHL